MIKLLFTFAASYTVTRAEIPSCTPARFKLYINDEQYADLQAVFDLNETLTSGELTNLEALAIKNRLLEILKKYHVEDPNSFIPETLQPLQLPTLATLCAQETAKQFSTINSDVDLPPQIQALLTNTDEKSNKKNFCPPIWREKRPLANLILKRILQSIANIDQTVLEDRYTGEQISAPILHITSGFGDPPTLKMVLTVMKKYRADINQVNRYGYDALYWALRNNRNPTNIAMLVECISLNKRYPKEGGKNALGICFREGTPACFNILYPKYLSLANDNNNDAQQSPHIFPDMLPLNPNRQQLFQIMLQHENSDDQHILGKHYRTYLIIGFCQKDAYLFFHERCQPLLSQLSSDQRNEMMTALYYARYQHFIAEITDSNTKYYQEQWLNNLNTIEETLKHYGIYVNSTNGNMIKEFLLNRRSAYPIVGSTYVFFCKHPTLLSNDHVLSQTTVDYFWRMRHPVQIGRAAYPSPKANYTLLEIHYLLCFFLPFFTILISAAMLMSTGLLTFLGADTILASNYFIAPSTIIFLSSLTTLSSSTATLTKITHMAKKPYQYCHQFFHPAETQGADHHETSCARLHPISK